jgi:threonine/homoserine/homoserine lactone efflux protein
MEIEGKHAMTMTSLIVYAGALTLAAATPGPAIVSIVATAMTKGWKAASGLALGVAIGDVLLAMFVLFGLAFVAHSLGWMFLAIKVVGAAYLVWLGLKLWLSSKRNEPQGLDRNRSGVARNFVMGVMISLGNPKAMFFHAGMISLLLDMRHLTMVDAFVVALIILCVDLTVCFAYAFASFRARGFFHSPQRIKLMNRAAGSAMIGTGVLVASRT